MQRLKLSLACLLCVSWVCAARAQTTPESDPGVAALQQFSGSATFRGTYFDIRTMTGDGVGYQHGYTQIGATLPTWMGEDTVLIPTARVIVTDTSKVGANGGAVLRRYSDSWDRIVGANLWFDYDESTNNFNYRQWGFGLETLGQWWDLRANGYIPTSSGDNFVRSLSLATDPTFVGNSLVFLGQGLFEEAVAGGDIEFGMPLTAATPWLRGFAGMYFYDTRQQDPVGVRARIEAWVSDDLSIAVNVTEDTNFGTNVNAVVDWRFSGWKPTRYFPQWTTYERMLMPVQRNWRIATATYQQEVLVPAVDCETGEPFFVVWIDSSNPNPGDGTAENPYNFLPASVPEADLILVKSGDTTLFNPLVGSITLTDGQKMFGEGCAAFVTVCANFDGIVVENQTIQLPGFEDTGNHPYLSSTGNIITLANDNVVSGFNLIDAGGFAITNNPATGSYNFDLHCLNIVGNAGGISLSNASGIGNISDVTAMNNPAGGIRIDTGASALALTITDVSSNSLPAGVQDFGIMLNADDGALLVGLTNVSTNRNDIGLHLVSHTEVLEATLDNVAANSNTDHGILVNAFGSTISLDMQDVTANNNGGFGVVASVKSSSFAVAADGVVANGNADSNLHFELTNTPMQVQVANSSFNNSTTGSGVVINSTGGGGTIALTNVSGAGNFLDGLAIGAASSAAVTANVADSDFRNNGRNAIALTAQTSGQINFSASSVTANNSGQDGFHFDVLSGGILNADLSRVTLTNSGRSAVYGNLDDGTAVVTLTRSRGSNSGGDGMFLQAVNGSTLSVSVLQGDFSDSGQTVDPAAAIRIIADDSDVAVQTFNTPLNNTAPPGPQDDGLNVFADNAALVLVSLTSSDMSNNADNAMDLTADNGSQIGVNLQSSNGTDSGNDGILFVADNGSVINVSANQSNFDRSGMNGINGTLDNGSMATFNFVASSVSSSGKNGLLIFADNGSTFVGDFDGGSFVNSGQLLLGAGMQDANNLTADNGSTIDVSLINTPSGNLSGSTTQQHSLFAVITNGSTLLYNDANGDMSNNTLNAINVTIASGSAGQIDLTNTLAENSGEDGYLFLVDGVGSTLVSTVTNGSFNNSGSGLVTGSAINGTISNGGAAALAFSNTTSNNAYDHGLFITATGGSTFIGSFDASTFDAAGSPGGIPTTAGDAVRLVADASAMSVLMTNGSTGIAAGGDGLSITATNASTVLVSVADGSFSDEGQFTNLGAGVNVNASGNSLVSVSLTNTPTHNTTGTTQAWGLLFNVESGADFIFSDTGGDLTSNSLDGINGNTTGAGSTSTITLETTFVQFNGLNGAIFNVEDGGVLNFNIPNAGTISNNASFGVLAFVDGAGSQANFVFNNTFIDANGLILGGDGMAVFATNGADINGTITDSSLSGNQGVGLNLLLDGGSTGSITIDPTVIDNNGNEGIRAEVLAASSLLLDVQGDGTTSSSVSLNGSNGAFDNVMIIADGAGTMVETLFVDTVANGDPNGLFGRSGFNFIATNGAMFLAQLRAGTEASSNLNGNGVRFVADGAGTQAVLFMSDGFDADGDTIDDITGTNIFDGNGTNVITANGGPDSDVPLTGGGVFFQATNVDVAAIRFSGESTNNGNAADPVANRDIDGDGDGDHDGVYIRIDGANMAAIEFNGPINVSGNVDDAIDIAISNVGTLGTVTKASTLTPPNVTVAAAGGIVFDGVIITGNGGHGLNIELTNIGGTPDLTITNSQIMNNGGDGIRIILDNTPLGTLTIADNNQGASGAFSDYGFTGNTNNLGWFLQNTSTPGNDLTGFVMNIARSPLTWATTRGFFATPFDHFPPFSVAVGFESVNGILIDPALSPTTTIGGAVLVDGGVPDGSVTLELGFNDFQSTDFGFSWTLVAADAANNAIFNAGLMQNSPVAAIFDDGRIVVGQLTGAGIATFSGTTQYQAVLGGITDNGGDGIHIEQYNGSHIAAVRIDNNLIQANGGDGIDFNQTIDSDLPDIQITNNTIGPNAGGGILFGNVNGGAFASTAPLVISNNAVVGNVGGDAFRLVNPITTNTTIDFQFTNNQFSQSVLGAGVNIVLTAGGQTPTVDFTGNTINQNGFEGVTLVVADNVNVNANFDQNTINSNGLEGVNFGMGVNGDLVLDFTNNTVDFNGSHALNIPLQTGGSFTSTNFYGNEIGIAGLGNGGMGVRLVVPDGASFTWLLGDNTQGQNNIDANTDAGVGIDINGVGSTGLLIVENSTFRSNIDGTDARFNGDGLAVLETGAAIVNGSITNSEFSNNGFAADGADADGAGVKFTVTGDFGATFSQLNNFVIGGPTAADGNIMAGNSGNGISLERTANGQINNMTIAFNSVSANRGNGLYILAANESLTDTYTINNNSFSGNVGGNNGIFIPTGDATAIFVGNGILFDERADADIFADLDSNTISGNADNGIRLVERLNSAGDNRSITGTWTRNTITGNTNNGILLEGVMTGVVIGDPADLSLGNVISDNVNGSGIAITTAGQGTVLVGSNLIQRNGNLTQLGTAAEDAGIQVTVGGFLDLTVVNNDISLNRGDGIQWSTTGAGFGIVTGIVTIDSNNVSNNRGRGLDIMNRALSFAQVDITSNDINSNLLEGVYIVNTASNTQNQFNDSTAAMAADGSVLGSDPRMQVRFFDNELIGNGFNSNNTTTGLLVKVGTSDGSASIFDSGGFASNATTAAVGFGADPFLTTIPLRGGVTMTTDGNFFQGNFGDDIKFQSFVSTVNPNTGTTWNATTFDPSGYQTDPLARLDLWFRANIFDSEDVDNLTGIVTRNPSNVAFYNNADAVFKSRTTAQTPPGPFTNGARARNAQRQAAFIVPFTAPGAPPFFYPGVGDSTFRVSMDSDPAIFIDGFNVDFPSPVGTASDENGFAMPGAVSNGEQPFGWGRF